MSNKPKLIDRALLRKWPLPALDGELGKEERGQVLVLGGSTRVPGAVMLAGAAALRAGAGRLQIATSRSVAPAVAVAMPEACVWPLEESRDGEPKPRSHRAIRAQIDRCNALLVGPGMYDVGLGRSLLEECVHRKSGATFVVDGASLAALAEAPRCLHGHGGGAVLTPHAGEMAKMCKVERDCVLADPQAMALEHARKFEAVVVLKGPVSYVATPDGRLFQSTNGNLGLGTSGSGDALAGLITGLCARGATPEQAAVWGVFLHASAGDVLARAMGGLGFLARELLPQIPPLLDEVSAPARGARGRSPAGKRKSRAVRARTTKS
jgi:ADP-dependent NAD(P)H-hydrate dehydratase